MVKMQNKTIRQFLQDDGINKIISCATDKTITIDLKLGSEKRKRRLGVITKSTKTFKIKRIRTKHLFRKGNAYGFNHYVLSTGKSFDTVTLSDDFSDWKIPVSYILEKGKYLMFKQQGFELQIFVSLGDLEPYRILPKENRRF